MAHYGEVDQIEMQIEGMESSVDYLEGMLDRIELKLQDLQKMEK